VSYSLNLAGNAQADIRKLELWLQEEVLDEIDLLTNDASLLPAPGSEGDSIYVFVRDAAGMRHHVCVDDCA
jgi:hypothetical protein